MLKRIALIAVLCILPCGVALADNATVAAPDPLPTAWLEFSITDYGYMDPDTGQDLPSIEGRTNDGPGQRFIHKGRNYPGLTRVDKLFGADGKESVLVLVQGKADAIEALGGTRKSASEALRLLKEKYGFPEETLLVGGLPIVP